MNWLSRRQNKVALAMLLGIVSLLGIAVTAYTLPIVDATTTPLPLQLSTVTIPTETLAASTPSNVWYTATSGSGSFCVEGFVVNPLVPTTPTSTAAIHLDRIDGNGLSQAYFTLVDGSTGGLSPQDIILSYGNHICAKKTLTFQATEYAGGTGINITLIGQATVLAAHGNVVKITGSTTPPQ